MPIVQCPSCWDEVTAPENPPADAVARCPLCQEEFPLAKVMDVLPPALIIVSGGESLPSDDGSMHVAPAAGMSGAEAAASSFDFSEKAAPSAKNTTAAANRRTTRPKRKQANPIWEVVKVAGGGIIGLSLGQVILWWAFHKDPADLAPKIPTAMQWILPSALRTASPINTPNGDNDSGDNVGSFPLGDAGMPFETKGDDPATDTDEKPTGFMGQAGTQPPKNGSKNNRQRDQATSGPTSVPPPKPATVVRVSNSPSFGPGELETAIDEAQASFEAWKEATESGKDANPAARAFYTQFAKLGHTIAYADVAHRENQQLAKRAENLTKRLPPNARKMFGAASASWLRNKRSNDGVALYGEVTRIEPQGELYETIVRLTDRGGRRVSIISGVDPSTKFKTGDTVLVLGGIVEDPGERVEGYDGLAPMVILGGLPVKFQQRAATKAGGEKAGGGLSNSPVNELNKTKPADSDSPPPPEPAPAKNQPPQVADPKSVDTEDSSSGQPKRAGETKPAEPKKTEPKKTEPKKTEPKKTEPKKTEPKDTEPKQTEPKAAKPKPAEQPDGTPPPPEDPPQAGAQTEPGKQDPTPPAVAPSKGAAPKKDGESESDPNPEADPKQASEPKKPVDGSNN